jgi:hypothetical protein
MKIAASQFQTMGESCFRGYVAREVKRLAGAQKAHLETPEVAEAWVIKGHEEGKQYGLVTEAEHSRFNDLRLAQGPEFPSPLEMEVLHDRELSAAGKLDELEAQWIFSNR